MNISDKFSDEQKAIIHEVWGETLRKQDELLVNIKAHQSELEDLLKLIAPDGTKFCAYFEELLQAGANDKRFEMDHNLEWTRHTRPFVEAFFHARYFLEMAVKYGATLEKAPELMLSGWAVLLCLYDIR